MAHKGTKRVTTGFDRYLEERLRNPSFAAEYAAATLEIQKAQEALRLTPDPPSPRRRAFARPRAIPAPALRGGPSARPRRPPRG